MMQKFSRELEPSKTVSLHLFVLRGYLIFESFLKNGRNDQRVEIVYIWKLSMCFLDHSCNAFATFDQILFLVSKSR